MAKDAENVERTQPTQPKKGEPVEIPIPTRDAFLRDMAKVAPPVERAAEPRDDGDDERPAGG